MIKLSLSFLVGPNSPGVREVSPDTILRVVIAFVGIGSRESRIWQSNGEGNMTQLSSGESESLSLSSGHSFLTCLRMLASTLDPELPSVLSLPELLDPREPKLLDPRLVRGLNFS